MEDAMSFEEYEKQTSIAQEVLDKLYSIEGASVAHLLVAADILALAITRNPENREEVIKALIDTADDILDSTKDIEVE